MRRRRVKSHEERWEKERRKEETTELILERKQKCFNNLKEYQSGQVCNYCISVNDSCVYRCQTE